jgi:LEA14-like dessication related protein
MKYLDGILRGLLKKRRRYVYPIFLFLILSCGKIKPLVYKKMDQFEMGNLLNGSNPILHVNIICYNPNRWGVTLKKADCKVFMDSVYMGKFMFDSAMHIPAHKDFVLPVNVKMDLQAVMNQGLQALWKQHFWIKVVGTSRLRKAGISFNVPIYYEGEQKIEF